MSVKESTILILTGEASGDLHAANLVKALYTIQPHVKISGMGGKKMQEAGVNIIENLDKLGVIGLTEILIKLPSLYQVYKKICRYIHSKKPNLVILIDCPGFNLRFAKVAKQAGCQVIYYITPQLWAWHQSRVKILKKYVDKLAVIFPFEMDFYKQFNMDAQFVGHPLTATVKPQFNPLDAKKRFGLTNDHPIVGIIPGSRRSEIKYLLPSFIATAKLLKEKFPDAQFVLPLASSLSTEDIQPYLHISDNLNITIITHQTYDVMNVCDALMITSGTATLEATLLEKPMVIAYKTSWLTYHVGRLLIKVKYLGLCNLIAKQSVVKECLQKEANPKIMADEIIKILTDNNYRERIIINLQQVKNALDVNNAVKIEDLVINTLVHCKINY